MPNAWVEHVREFARINNLSYGCAISNPECNSSYKKNKREAKAKPEAKAKAKPEANNEKEIKELEIDLIILKKEYYSKLGSAIIYKTMSGRRPKKTGLNQAKDGYNITKDKLEKLTNKKYEILESQTDYNKRSTKEDKKYEEAHKEALQRRANLIKYSPNPRPFIVIEKKKNGVIL